MLIIRYRAASCKKHKMSNLIYFACLSVVLALPSPPEYPTPAPTQAYNPDIGQTNVGGYGVNKDPYCHMVEKVVFENQCEPYTERTCYTQNKESCVPRLFNNCTGVIETKVERVCFDVNELVCDLVEAIHYETLEETYQVQRCFTGKGRVCDTTYKIDMTTKDDYQCTNVETPNCYMEEKVINDVTCTNSVEFNCKRDKSTKNDGYGPKGVVCDRKPTQSCYNTLWTRAPRTMGMVQRVLCAIENPLRAATTSLERSKWRFARLTCTGTARSSPTSSPSQLRSRTVTSSPRRSANLR